MKAMVFDPLGQHRHWCGWVIEYGKLYYENIPCSIPGFKILPPQIKQMIPQIKAENFAMIQKSVRI